MCVIVSILPVLRRKAVVRSIGEKNNPSPLSSKLFHYLTLIALSKLMHVNSQVSAQQPTRAFMMGARTIFSSEMIMSTSSKRRLLPGGVRALKMYLAEPLETALRVVSRSTTLIMVVKSERAQRALILSFIRAGGVKRMRSTRLTIAVETNRTSPSAFFQPSPIKAKFINRWLNTVRTPWTAA